MPGPFSRMKGVPTAGQEALQQPAIDPVMLFSSALSGGLAGGLGGMGRGAANFSVFDALNNLIAPNHPAMSNWLAAANVPELNLDMSEATKGLADFTEEEEEDLPSAMKSKGLFGLALSSLIADRAGLRLPRAFPSYFANIATGASKK